MLSLTNSRMRWSGAGDAAHAGSLARRLRRILAGGRVRDENGAALRGGFGPAPSHERGRVSTRAGFFVRRSRDVSECRDVKTPAPTRERVRAACEGGTPTLTRCSTATSTWRLAGTDAADHRGWTKAEARAGAESDAHARRAELRVIPDDSAAGPRPARREPAGVPARRGGRIVTGPKTDYESY